MKRPTFNAATVARSESSRSSTSVTLTDTIANTQTVNLSPQACEQLLKALLSAAPFGTAEQDARSTKNFLLAKGTRLFEGPQGTTGLEVHLGPGIAIHILLGGVLPEALEAQLREFRLPPTQTH